MVTCTGCRLTTNYSYDQASFIGPVTNITTTTAKTLLYSHVVQGKGLGEFTGVTGFPLGWVNIYLHAPTDGSCVGITGQLTLPSSQSGVLVTGQTGNSGVSYSSTEYCTGAVQGCKFEKLTFEFTGNPNIYRLAPQAITTVNSTTIAAWGSSSASLGTVVTPPYSKNHASQGLSITTPDIATGQLSEDNVNLPCGGVQRTVLSFEAFTPNVFGSVRADYYYYLSCTTCQTGVGGA